MAPLRRWLVLLLALLLPGPAGAAVVTVSKTADTADGVCDADCSLREAILSVIGQPGSTIHLPAGTYRLTIPRGVRGDNAPGPGTDGNLVVGSVLSIVGAGRDVTVIDARPNAKAQGIDRVMSVTLSGNATLSGVTLTGGRTAGQGGGLLSLAGDVALVDAAVIGNVASNGGGGLCLSNGGVATITRSEIAENTSGPMGSGGGIQNIQNSLTIVDSLIRDNTALVSTGGGIMNIDQQNRPNPAALLTIAGTTVVGNFAGDPERTALFEGAGGGIFNRSGQLVLTNSTLTANEAVPGFAPGFGPILGSGRGGGLAHQLLLGDDPEDGTTVINSTIAWNTAFTGSQVYGFETGAPAELANTLVAAGKGASPNCANENALDVGLASLGGNLSSDASPCGFTPPSDQTNLAPGLAPTLADNGGPTETLALLDASPALGAGDPTWCPPTDQRGLARGSPCDVGAVEAVPEPGAAASLLVAWGTVAVVARSRRARRPPRARC